MKMKNAVLLFCAIAFVSGVPSYADEIFDNGLDLADADFASFSFTSATTGTQYQVADDFAFGPGSWRLEGARWTGIFYEQGVFQPTIGETIDFDLLIFSDDSGKPTGTPLDTIPGTAIAHRVVTATGTDTGVFVNGADFDVSFSPIILDGLTSYWFVVSARGDFSYDLNNNPSGSAWAWIGRNGTGNAWQGGTNFQDEWFFQGRQQDFALYGQAIPEPSSTALLGVCFLSSWIRRKRHE